MTTLTRVTTLAWCVTLAACRAASPAASAPVATPSAAPIAAADARAVVSGTVAYRERMALPPDAAVDVWIVDTSPGIGAMAIVAEVTMPAQGRQVPLSFELRVEPGRVRHDRSYGIKAAIRAGGQMLFATDTPVPVITHGHPSLVALTLSRVTAGSASAP